MPYVTELCIQLQHAVSMYAGILQLGIMTSMSLYYNFQLVIVKA